MDSLARRHIMLCPFSWKTGAHFWRTKRDGSLVSLNPAKIKNFWIGLPPDTERIDAVFERRSDSRIIFFIGRLSAASQESAVKSRQLEVTKTFLKLNFMKVKMFTWSTYFPFGLRTSFSEGHWDRCRPSHLCGTAGGDKSSLVKHSKWNNIERSRWRYVIVRLFIYF